MCVARARARENKLEGREEEAENGRDGSYIYDLAERRANPRIARSELLSVNYRSFSTAFQTLREGETGAQRW